MSADTSNNAISRRGFIRNCVSFAACAGAVAANVAVASKLNLFGMESAEATQMPQGPLTKPAPGQPAPTPRGTAFSKLSLDGVKTRLGIMSDVHYCAYDSAARDKYERALETMQAIAPGISDFFVLGDISVAGHKEEFEAFASQTAELYSAYYADNPTMHLVMGNHDYWNSTQLKFEAVFARHETAELFSAKQNTVAKVEGATIIKLNGMGCYETDVMDYKISYTFLKEALNEAASNRPDDAILIMAHEPPAKINLIEDFERGDFGEGTKKDLIKLMQQYPQVRLFSGHIHNNLDKKESINKDLGFTSVHTSTLGSCYFYRGYQEDMLERGSQCVVLDIMEDNRLVLTCLDFDTQEFIGEAVEI